MEKQLYGKDIKPNKTVLLEYTKIIENYEKIYVFIKYYYLVEYLFVFLDKIV